MLLFKIGMSAEAHVGFPTLQANPNAKDPAKLLDRLGPLTPTLSDLAFLLPVLVLFWCTTGVGWLLTDSDTGWHIRTGEWILQNRQIPAVDMFSFTRAGQPWIAWEWLTDVAMAMAHHAGGLAGVVILALALLGATSACVYKVAVAECGHRLIAIALTWLAMAASTVHWLARPHLATPLLAALFCWILNSAERDGKATRLWSLPPLTTLWANLHGGFFVGIFLICTYAIGAAAEELIHGSRQNALPRSRKYVLAAGGCVLASFLNPYGYRLHIHIAHYLGASFYFARISEFQSLDFHSFIAAYFETLLLLAIAASAWHLRNGRWIHVLLLLSWSHLALFSARNIPIFAVIVAPSIGVAVCGWLEEAATPWLSKLNGKIAELEFDLRSIANRSTSRPWHFVLCLSMLVLVLLFTHPGRRKALSAAFDGDRFPVEAASFLSQEKLVSPLRLYSSWQWGGYLIYRLWPSLRVFNDGRTDFYGPDFVEEGLRAWNVSPDWSNILDRYRVNATLVPVDSPLASALKENPEWKPVYQDHVALLFTKVEKGK